MRLSIIRHGITEANEKRLYCGSTDVALSGQGRSGLVSLRERLNYPEAAVYITSGLRRAIETLQILYNRKPDLIMEEFNEMRFGDFEMKSSEELKDEAAYQLWINGGSGAVCPCGESRDTFENRVRAGLDKLSGLDAESIVIVSHGGVVVSIMDHLFPGKKTFYEWQPDFGRGYTFEINSGNAALISEL